MGYTIYWRTLERLSEDEVVASLRFLALEHDRGLLRVVSYEPRASVVLSPLGPAACERIMFSPVGGEIGLGFCKLVRGSNEEVEVKRLLSELAMMLGGKLRVWCDDGIDYTSGGVVGYALCDCPLQE